MRQKVAKDAAVARIAARQYGVVSTQQLLSAGLTPSGIARRANACRLHRVHQGVYAVGHRSLSFRGACMAAVLACGRPSARAEGEGPAGSSPAEEVEGSGDSDPAIGGGMADTRAGGRGTVLGRWGAAISHRSAAVLWKLLHRAEGPIDVSVPGSGGKARRTGIQAHRSISLLPADITSLRGIPVTTPARTISDLDRAVSGGGGRPPVSASELRQAIRQADVLGLPLGDEVGRDGTRSELERAFLRLCRRTGLPRPEINVRLGSYLVDFLWRQPRLVVETDGYRYHRGRAAFEEDRGRDLALRALGYETIRLSYRQVLGDPGRVSASLAKALRRSN